MEQRVLMVFLWLWSSAPRSMANNMVVYNETSTTMKVRWEEAEGATAYRLVYKSINASEPQLESELHVGGEVTTVLLVKLKPNTAYALELFAIHGESASDLQEGTGVTLPVPPAGVLRITNVTYSTMRLRWDAAPGVIKTIISYKSQDGGLKDVTGLQDAEKNSTKVEVDGGITTLDLSGLLSQTEYDVAVTPVYDAGPGSVMLGIAITDVVPDPKNLKVSVLTHNSLRATWDHGAPDVALYRIGWTSDQLGEKNFQFAILNGDETTFDFEVEPNEEYVIHVTAIYPDESVSEELTLMGSERRSPDDVRLVGGASRCAGMLERRDGGDWRAVNVSLSEWNLTSAETVCRTLDCGSVLSLSPSETSSRTEPPPDSRNLQITCSDPDEEVRLLGGSSNCSGRLEWKHRGDWRPVGPYYSYWNLKTTAVICGRLGCGSAVSSRLIEESSDRPVWRIKPDCVQFKSTIKDCVTADAQSTKSVLEITCSDSVRLVNGTGLCSGRLEVKSDQIWSPLCEKDLDLQGAQVVCREIGCGASLDIQGTMFGGVEAPSWTRDFQCEGNESTLLDCGGSGSARNTCPPGKAVGLSCADPDYIRLVGESSRCAGTLGVKYMEEWRALVEWGSDWDQNSAAVVCKTLKCGSAVSTRRVKQRNRRLVWWIRPSCVQTASSLFQCLDHRPVSSSSGLEVTCSDLLEKPNISFSFSTDGVSEATPQGYQAVTGTSFNITCSIRPQYEGGDFQLLFSDSKTTKSFNLTAVDHSAHFLFPPADQSHGGQYSCVYHLHVFSHHFSSESRTLSLAVRAPLRDLIIRCVVLLGGLLSYDIALYCYFKVKTKQQPPVLSNEDRVEMEIVAIPLVST